MNKNISTTLHLRKEIDDALGVIADELSLDKPALMRMILARFARGHGIVGTDASQVGMSKVELIACLNEMTRDSSELKDKASDPKRQYVMVAPDYRTYRISIERVD